MDQRDGAEPCRVRNDARQLQLLRAPKRPCAWTANGVHDRCAAADPRYLFALPCTKCGLAVWNVKRCCTPRRWWHARQCTALPMLPSSTVGLTLLSSLRQPDELRVLA